MRYLITETLTLGVGWSDALSVAQSLSAMSLVGGPIALSAAAGLLGVVIGLVRRSTRGHR